MTKYLPLGGDGMKSVRIAILGFGNVGQGVWKVLTRRSGYEIEVAKILVRDINKTRDIDVPKDILTTDPEEIFDDNSIKIVVELMGGLNPAKDYMLKAIEKGKHVVTANKLVIATEGTQLFRAANKQKVMLCYEASVAGGIPVIHGLNESLTANKIEKVIGIINGTTNYILTKMTREGMDFREALKLAQEKGFAEADPTSDVEGYDAVYKLSILSSLAFGTNVSVDSIYREGITNIEPIDIQYAGEFGYTIKLLAIVKDENNSLEVRVHPAMVPSTHPIANVNDSFNAIFIKGNAVGDLVFIGRGAGDLPTGSAVVGDIISILRSNLDLSNGANTKMKQEQIEIKDMDETECEYYIRISAKDAPGVLGEVTSIFGKNNVSLSSVIQKGEYTEYVPVVYITHKTLERNIRKSIDAISKLPSIKKVNNIIRVEKF